MPGRDSLSLWKNAGNAVPTDGPAEHVSLLSRMPDVRPEEFPAELRGLIQAALVVRGRILANRFLQSWVRWWFWALVGLLTAGALSPKLAVPLIVATVALALGALIVTFRNWRMRPSPYEAARRLDSSAGLRDRLSTALYWGTAPSPDEMILCQRKDALKHLARVNPRSYFSVRLPDAARRTALLAVAVAGLLFYRVYHRPPVVALLQGMARSQAVQALLNPFKQDVQAEIRKMLTLAGQSVDAMSERKEVDVQDSQDSLWKSQKDSSGQGDEQRQGMPGDSGQSNQSSRQTDAQNSRNAQQGSQQPSSQNNQSNGTNGKANSQQKQSTGSSQGGHESSTQSLFQKLKNLLSSSQTPQKADNRNNKNQSRPSQRPPQSANSQQSNRGKESNNQQQSGGAPSAQQRRMTKMNGTGAGSQEGYKELKTRSDAPATKTQADQVALQNNKADDNLRVRIPGEVGTAKVPLGSASPQGVAAIKGAEQENIPARYRVYVQRYFERSDSGAR